MGESERGLAVTALWTHLDAGRLSPGEHEERCARAAAARTRADVEALFADLPAPHPDLSGAALPATPKPAPVRHTVSRKLYGVGVLVFVLGTAASITLTVLSGMWWTFFVAGGLFTAIKAMADVYARKECQANRATRRG